MTDQPNDQPMKTPRKALDVVFQNVCKAPGCVVGLVGKDECSACYGTGLEPLTPASQLTNNPKGGYSRLCPDKRHEDPDNSGLCIKCGGIMYPDVDDWEETPERCIGERSKMEPLLRDTEIVLYGDANDDSFREGMGAGRDFYEDKITSGELMVVRTVRFVSNDHDANIDCDSCGWSICYLHVEDSPMTYCPGCGAKITQ